MPRSDSSSTPARARLALVQATLALAAVAWPASPFRTGRPQHRRRSVRTERSIRLSRSSSRSRRVPAAAPAPPARRAVSRRPTSGSSNSARRPRALYRGGVAGLGADRSGRHRPAAFARRCADAVARVDAGELDPAARLRVSSPAVRGRPSRRVDYRTAFAGFAAHLDDAQVSALRVAQGPRRQRDPSRSEALL